MPSLPNISSHGSNDSFAMSCFKLPCHGRDDLDPATCCEWETQVLYHLTVSEMEALWRLAESWTEALCRLSVQ